MTDEIKRLRSEFASSGYDVKKLSVAPSSDREELPELTELSVACRRLGAINVATDTQDEYNARWSRANLALTAAESLFARVQRENERLKRDSELLDYLDSLGRFNVGLNPHDGIQRYTLNAVGNGIPVILRLWHKDRGGENQSLRDAIDKARSAHTDGETRE